MTVIGDARSHLQSTLRPGETLLWAGQPDPKVRFSKADLYLVPFSVFFCGFSIFWLTGALRSGAPLPFALFGVPFVAVGLWLLIGRFFYKAYRASRTVYGLIGSKAVIRVAGSTTEVPLRSAPLTTTASRDGSHITVEPVSASTSWWSQNVPFTSPMNTGAEFLGWSSYTRASHDVADVEGLQRALDQAVADSDNGRWNWR